MCQRGRETDPSAAGPEIPTALLQSYLRAIYRVDADPSAICLRIGETIPELDLWLAAVGATGTSGFAFLSAANPGSLPLPDDENRARHARLVARVEACGLPALAGESYDGTSGGWREASLLVAGIERATAVAIAREFGQVALLYGATGAAVELVWTGEAIVDRSGPQR